MYTLKITWADPTDLSDCKDEATVVTCDDWNEIIGIAHSADFMRWARHNGCTGIELYVGSVYYSYISLGRVLATFSEFFSWADYV